MPDHIPDAGNMVPRRIQRRRTKGWKMPPGAVYVGRPSRWGNPWAVLSPILHGMPWRVTGPRVVWNLERHSSQKAASYRAADLFRMETQARLDPSPLGFRPSDVGHLRGKNLACWCPVCPAHADGKPLGTSCADCTPCHADWLLGLANAPLRCEAV